MKILVTGGAGFIGSHTCVELLDAGHDIVVADNFCNSKPEVIKTIKKISGKEFPFYEADLVDKDVIERIFSEHKFDAVIHFAGLKAVGESVSIPLKYYYNNLMSTIALCEVMTKHKMKNLVFSSSATVYGDPNSVPIKEDFPLSATNPYGRTKLMIEEILRDLYVSDNEWSIALLRYFNPIGAHKSGLIGEDPNGIPNNLMPYITKVAAGELEVLNVFGDDYETRDGTGVRDFIHVVDLSIGHIKAVEKVVTQKGCHAYNLGTGRGYSVLDLVNTFERVNEVKVKYAIAPRRPGDIARCYADPIKAQTELGWKAERDIDQMCRDAWAYVANSIK